MSDLNPKSAKPNQSDSSDLTWRDARYQRFYEVVDQLTAELQEHVWAETGKPKRRVKGAGLDRLHYSVECLVRDCVAVVLQMHRKGEASIKRGQYHYGANRPDFVVVIFTLVHQRLQGHLLCHYLEN